MDRTDLCFAQSFVRFRMPEGMPRPLYEGMPVPWTAKLSARDGERGVVVEFSDGDFNRMNLAYHGGRCALCGKLVAGECGVIADSGGVIVEGAAMHVRCARFAHRHCPKLRDGGYTLWLGDPAEIELTTRIVGASLPPSFRALETRTGDGEVVRYRHQPLAEFVS